MDPLPGTEASVVMGSLVGNKIEVPEPRTEVMSRSLSVCESCSTLEEKASVPSLSSGGYRNLDSCLGMSDVAVAVFLDDS